MFNIVDTPNFAAVFGGGEFILAALAALLVLAAIFAVLSPSVPKLFRAFRRKLAVLALAASVALLPTPALASKEAQGNREAVLIIAGIALVVAVVVVAASNAESAFADSANEIPEGAETPLSLGSFRLSEHAGYGGETQAHPPLSAWNEASAEWESGDLLSGKSESGFLGKLSRVPANALAKISGTTWAQSGWSIRPSMALTDSQNADDARFLLRMERAF